MTKHLEAMSRQVLSRPVPSGWVKSGQGTARHVLSWLPSQVSADLVRSGLVMSRHGGPE